MVIVMNHSIVYKYMKYKEFIPGIVLKLDEKNLNLDDLLFLINNKRKDCYRFEICNNYFVFKEDMKGNKNWICPDNCEYYKNNGLFEHKKIEVSREEIEEINEDFDNMTTFEIYRFFCQEFVSKIYTDKYKGISIEEYTNTSNTSRRTK